MTKFLKIKTNRRSFLIRKICPECLDNFSKVITKPNTEIKAFWQCKTCGSHVEMIVNRPDPKIEPKIEIQKPIF